MNDARTLRLLPHEIVFGGFLAATGAGLVFSRGALVRDVLLFFGLLAVGLALVVWCRRDATLGRWRVRLAFYPIAMNATYFALKTAGPAIHPQLQDAALQAADRALLGSNASVWMQRFLHPALTEFMSFCYVIFFPYLLFSWIVYLAQKDLRLMQKFWSELIL